MTILVQNLIKKLDEIAPFDSQEEWDNSGWQINLHKEKINKILLATTITKKVLTQAIKLNCDFIVSHHPLIFSPLKKIDNEIIISAIKNDIQIISFHTNFDKAKNGTTESLLNKLKIYDFKKINDFFAVSHSFSSQILDDIILNVKLAFNLEKIKVINYECNKKIEKIGVCAGSGAEFINDALSQNCDLYITSDLKYHDFCNLENLTIFDIGHLDSEKGSLKNLKENLSDLEIEILVADEKNNYQII